MVFSIRIINLIDNLPETKVVNVIAGQILRSASSVGANYRAARRSKSLKDFIHKLKIVEEEADETLYWLELLDKRNIGPKEEIKSLITETNELLGIFVTSINTSRARLSAQNQK